MLRGVPPKATVLDVLNFFCDMDVQHNDVELKRKVSNGTQEVCSVRTVLRAARRYFVSFS